MVPLGCISSVALSTYCNVAKAQGLLVDNCVDIDSYCHVMGRHRGFRSITACLPFKCIAIDTYRNPRPGMIGFIFVLPD